MARYTLFVALLLLASGISAAESDRVQVHEDRDALTSQLRFVATNGEVDWGDLFRGISRLNGYDDAEFRGALPKSSFKLDGRFARWSMNAFNWLMQPCVRCSLGSGDSKALTITVDRAASRQYVNNAKSKVRQAWKRTDWRQVPPRYGIELLEPTDETNDIVILIHGLNSRPEDLRGFIPIIRRASLTPATFRYPNDQPIDRSAKLLAKELISLKKRKPHARIRLVTHSMGGLVARGVIESNALDPGIVSQCIMIAPPNHGSTLARVAAVMDCYEFFTSSQRRGTGLLVESVADGLGEATADLQPRSVFLDRLNAGPRNPHVSYTILLGTKGPLDHAEMDRLRQRVRSVSDHGRYLRFAASKLNAALADLDEVIDGRGDGVVSIKRGRLASVDDVVVLPFSHRSILDPTPSASRNAYQIVERRLTRL